MAVDDPSGLTWAAPGDDDTGIDQRTLRALREVMTVLHEAADLYQVVSESGRAYHVDLREPACTCPDFQTRQTACKHLRRVTIATGTAPADPLRTQLRAAIRERQRELDRLRGAVQDLEETVDAYEDALDCLAAIEPRR